MLQITETVTKADGNASENGPDEQESGKCDGS